MKKDGANLQPPPGYTIPVTFVLNVHPLVLALATSHAFNKLIALTQDLIVEAHTQSANPTNLTVLPKKLALIYQLDSVNHLVPGQLTLALTVNNVGVMEKIALDIKTMVLVIVSPPSIAETGQPLAKQPLKPIFEQMLIDNKILSTFI